MNSNIIRKLLSLQTSNYNGEPLLPIILNDCCHLTPSSSEFGFCDRFESKGNFVTNAARGSAERSDLSVMTKRKRPSDRRDSTLLRKYLRLTWCPRSVSCDQLVATDTNGYTYISTGISALDGLLGGGIATTEITEFVGKSAVGKTQLCLNLCANVVHDGTTPTTVLYIDTAGNFSPSALLDTMQRLYCSEPVSQRMDRLKRIRVATVTSLAELIDVLVRVRTILAHTRNNAQPSTPGDPFFTNLKLVILDGVAIPFLPFMGIVPRLAKGELKIVTAEIRRIIRLCQCAFVVVNHAKASFRGDGTASSNQDETAGCLGLAWSHVAHKRLMIKRTETHVADTTITLQAKLFELHDDIVCSSVVPKTCIYTLC